VTGVKNIDSSQNKISSATQNYRYVEG